jgi:hypothetical protein
MKHVSKPRTDIMQAPLTKEPEVLISEISIGALLDKGLLSLHREMLNLTQMTAKGKLSAADARDLRDTVKLLFELKDRENQLLKDKTDDELKAMAEYVNTNE